MWVTALSGSYHRFRDDSGRGKLRKKAKGDRSIMRGNSI